MRSVFLVALMFCASFCKAQYDDQGIIDLFIQEGLVKFNWHCLTYKGVSAGLYDECARESFGRYNIVDVQHNENHRVYTVTELKDLNAYDASYADSAIELLKTGNTENMLHFTDSIYAIGISTDIETFLSLQKKMIGNLQMFDNPHKEAIFIKARKRTYIIISGMALFAKAAGKFILYFKVSDNNKLALAKLDFIPVNNQQNIFIKAIAQNDIRNLQDKNLKAFEQNFSPWFSKQVSKQRKRFESELANYQITDSLYSFRLYCRGGYMELRGVYFTQHSDDKIEISYTLFDKKFAIDLVKQEEYMKQTNNFKPIELTPGPEKP